MSMLQALMVVHIRTPVGGFINHSEESNCFKLESPEETVITYLFSSY